MYHLHPIEVSLPSRSCLTWIQLPRYLCNLDPCSSSPPSRCTNLHLSSIPISPPIEVVRVASKLHPNHISTMPGLWDVHLTSIYVHSHCHRSPLIGISSPSKSRFTCVLVESHLNLSHDNCISPPSRSTKLHLSSIQASSQTHTGFKMCNSPPSRTFLNWRCASQLNPGPISTPSRSRDLWVLSTQAPKFTFHLCLSWILPQSGSWYLHLAYIQVTSHLHPGPPNCILVPSKHHLKPIQVSRCVSHLHPGPFSTGELYLSSIPVPYHPIHVSRCAYQLNPGPISTPSRSRDFCLLSTQAPRFTFLLCLSWILPQSRSRFCISPTSR